MNKEKDKKTGGNAMMRICLLAAMTAAGSALPCSRIWATGTGGQAVSRTNVAVQAVSKAKEVVTVEGAVYEKASGEILPGASIAIYVNGKLLTGTSADIDGKFKINVPKGNFEIRVSYMGMLTQTISSKEKALKNLKIFLEEDSHTIQDVVVTGYVNKNKESFTGSVTQIKGEELKMVSNTNIITAIAALTPGMALVQNSAQGSNPNHVEELVLRGTTSFSNSGQDVNQPTIILDGTEITMQELYDLDMNEVESINVL